MLILHFLGRQDLQDISKQLLKTASLNPLELAIIAFLAKQTQVIT